MSDTPRTDEIFLDLRKHNCGHAAFEVAIEDVRQLELENAELKTELKGLRSLFELQHKRVVEADKLWQKAHDQPNVWPDLGELIDWLLSMAQGCHSCEYGPMCSKEPAICSGCKFAMKKQEGGKNNWRPKRQKGSE